MKKLSHYLLFYKSAILIGGLIILLSSLLILPSPLITRHILDVTIPEKKIVELIFLLLGVLGLLFVTKILGYYQSLIFIKLNNKIVLDIKKDLITKLQRTSFTELNKFNEGYLLSRINSEVEMIRSLFADTIINIIKDILTFIVGLVAIFVIHWKLAILCCLLLPLYFYTTYHYGKIIKKISRQYLETNSQTFGVLQEVVSSLEICRKFSKQKFAILKYFSQAKKSYREQLLLSKKSLENGFVNGILTGLIPLVIIGYGGFEIINERLTIGSIIAFNSFVGYLFGPTNRLVNVNIQIQKARVALNRLEEIFNLAEEPINKDFVIPNKIESLEFDNIRFGYEEEIKNDEKCKSNHLGKFINDSKSVTLSGVERVTNTQNTTNLILKGFSLKISAGEKIGIVGGSGSGKTTLINILLGLFPTKSGGIRINNEELTQADLAQLRKEIAIVEQEPTLFNDSIYENIKFGKNNANNDEVLDACKKANAHDFILELAEKYDTKIQNQGNNLSIGQKQRIAIARALIRQPKILILDEATSNIDTLSEKKINDVIENLSHEMIVIIIAHRLSTIRNCDKIVVMQEGQNLESGNHFELIENDGVYKEMVVSGNG